VYCKDSNRKGSHEHERFDFLGYTFRPRLARSGAGEKFVSFIPAVSDDAAKAIRRRVKRWRLHLWSDQDLADLAREINPTVRGWINYYGRFYRTELIQALQHINVYLIRWAMRKHKRLRARPARANGSWRRSPNGSRACSHTGSGGRRRRLGPVSREAHAGI
jgi:RNA-directed DNA polymerase